MEPREVRSLLDYCRADLPALLGCLEEAVEIESPSGCPAAIDRMAEFFARALKESGAEVRLLPHAKAGAAVLARVPGGNQAAAPILLIGHHDTVWELGTLRRMPFRIRAGRAYGPGILDMKSGIVCAVWAIRALRARKIAPAAPVRLFLNPDEEMSSLAFRKRLMSEARRARAALILEPAAKGGALKTSRKGVGEFIISVDGRSAHAGINPQAGVNAISELLRQLLRIEKLARPESGLTLNVGVIQGGTRSNVIPEKASARVDIRVSRTRDGRRIERQVRALKPIHPEARIEVRGGVNRPPMERARAASLFKQARELGWQLGMRLAEASTGGGSDGNFTAALGVPTLDGLGGVGDGAHARHEHVLIRELPRRAALLAALLATL